MSSSKSQPLELAVALYDFKPVKPTDLGFVEGDVLQIVKRSDSKNWWKAKRIVDRSDGSQTATDELVPGDIPKTYIKMFDQSAVVVAFHPWEAQDDTEISFTAGTVVLVYEKHETGWWKGRTISNPQQGLFPGTYVREFNQPRPPKPSSESPSSRADGHGPNNHDDAAPTPEDEGPPELFEPGAEVLAAVHGSATATFSLDDFDAFDELMANGWCFNPDFNMHNVEGNGGDKPTPGREVSVHMSLFAWDGNTGELQRLASSCANVNAAAAAPVTFRVQHDSWFQDDGEWMQGSGSDECAGWAAGDKVIAAVHAAVQKLTAGSVCEIVSSPRLAFGEEDTQVAGRKVARNSQVRSHEVPSLQQRRA